VTKQCQIQQHKQQKRTGLCMMEWMKVGDKRQKTNTMHVMKKNPE
jgi:hypothetical protein